MPHSINEKKAAQELGELLVGKVDGVDEVALSFREDLDRLAIEVHVTTERAKELIRKQYSSFQGYRVYVEKMPGKIVFLRGRKKARASRHT